MSIECGSLYVVATPIGNLEDISARALAVLGSVDVVLAEDTRHSTKLLTHHGLRVALQSLHEHNEEHKADKLIQALRAGKRMALISDAGTPLISDPGLRLVRLAHAAGVPVIPLPGPCALICALSAAGLPTDRFCFEGFLPGKTAQRRQRLIALSTEPRTMVFFEAPHRIERSVRALSEAFGEDRPAALARELTKVFETIKQDSLGGLSDWLAEDENHRKGEFVLIVAGAEKRAESEETHDALLLALLGELPLRQAVSIAVRATGAPRNALYSRATQLLGQGPGR